MMGKLKRDITDNRYKIAAVLFWITVWQVLSMAVGREMLLASPFAVMGALWGLFREAEFWQSVMYSFSRIVLGFFMAIAAGIVLGACSHRSRLVREILAPPMVIIKTTPVASFIIIALIWVHSKNLSVLISFLMVLPVVYSNMLQGIQSTDQKLLEMAKVFRVPRMKKMIYIYIPAVMPYFISACSVGLGFCWKSGIAAEVIGLPSRSIGARLYEAKLYLMTKELFAWTIVIIIISVFFEKTVMRAIHFVERRVKRYGS
ncbi:NitT/TauT family transport system permease protein [Anaerobium acetethylicum]|uniref:NitT/TauT family transport system permease protein n=2 Tax=Anaerobium acetethylicum TaxID=1619234 RepID=A0A1D3TR37_9FIRM|nr:NitT/TauT family transport system permease protein [Anaerobium acetethylicum]